MSVKKNIVQLYISWNLVEKKEKYGLFVVYGLVVVCTESKLSAVTCVVKKICFVINLIKFNFYHSEPRNEKRRNPFIGSFFVRLSVRMFVRQGLFFPATAEGNKSNYYYQVPTKMYNYIVL